MIAAVFALSAACSGAPAEHGERRRDEPPAVVTTEEAAPAVILDTLKAHATAESEASADLYPAASGKVLRVYKDEGDLVRAGDLLALLENAPLDAAAERAAAQLTRVEDELATSERLHQQGALSDRDLAELRLSATTARATAREAHKTAEHTRITAPFAGVVGLRDLVEGQLAMSSQRAFQVVDPTRLRVVATLPEREVRRVQQGQRARLSPAYDPSGAVDAEVRRISPVIDPASGTFRVTLALDPNQTLILPGQYVSIDLAVAEVQAPLTVPRSALLWEEGAPVLYRLAPLKPKEEEEKRADEAPPFWSRWLPKDEGEGEGEDGPREALATHLAERCPVTLGVVDATRAEVREGIAPGDAVITVGQALLRDGAPVRLSTDVEKTP